ncbi:MAG: hypothetical protein ABI678_28625 [Kofleriaceae bacterium]
MRLVAFMMIASCTGTLDPGGSGGPDVIDGGNGGGDGGGSGSAVSDAGVNAMFPCKNVVTPPGNGHHNPGQDCLNGCHNHGFTLAGTLYNAAATAVLPGASITVKDANGATFDMVAQQNGNFYTSKVIAFPITVYASACPASTPMSAAIATGNGGCNKSGCHATGAQGRLHL